MVSALSWRASFILLAIPAFVLARLVHPTGLGAVRNTGAVVVIGVVIALVLKALDGRLPAIRR